MRISRNTLVVTIVVVTLLAAAGAGGGFSFRKLIPAKWLMPSAMRKAMATECVKCHSQKTEGIFRDWASGQHARSGVDCYKCHRANSDNAVDQKHFQYDSRPISTVVSPLTCGSCHRQQLQQFASSKHANTLKIISQIDPWLREALAGLVEITSGCAACHGSKVELVGGIPDPATWPNVGIGRQNPDGSHGSCSACHTRHRFAVSEARKPEACNQCHLGPDHPQMEIYAESKHGAIYQTEGQGWNWDTPNSGTWQAGKDFRAPTCASCHISGGTNFSATHDVGKRLSWELQTPESVHPENFKPWPATVNWQEARLEMKKVCLQCHGQVWVEQHFITLDDAVASYNTKYFRPMKNLLEKLYADGKLDGTSLLDERIELEFYEFWHHEGRRARMGVAMSAPDYAWWHGFYPLKKNLRRISILAEEDSSNTMVWQKRKLPSGR